MLHTLLDASVRFGFLHYCVLQSDFLVIHRFSNFNAVGSRPLLLTEANTAANL